ncbi:MAG: ATP-binding cassette domain-containing protein [Prevotella sp.]|nr:ATP-binding cassette domain-containing protein [Prevotella sp.]
MIEIQDISYKYAGSRVNVFDHFSLTLNENSIYGLLGKNGTGKSTLLYLISGLLRQQKGSVKVDGMESRERMPEMLREVFIVPEELELPPLSLESFVKLNEPFYPRFSHELLQNCLKEFELPADLKFNELSMGQKKKVYMSFALATNTKLLLLDEPTNGLDIPSKSQFRKVVASGMSDGRTIVISAHQVHDVEQLLDRIVIINNKQLLLNASTAAITSKYSFGYRMPSEMGSDVIYAEPTIQGNAVITLREQDAEETPLNLELLFNAVNKNLINQ